jgi:hypothetical protein
MTSVGNDQRRKLNSVQRRSYWTACGAVLGTLWYVEVSLDPAVVTAKLEQQDPQVLDLLAG